jgi:GxxExxY protein
VHRTLGVGLLESADQQCIAYELRSRGLKVDLEVTLPIEYNGTRIDAGYLINWNVKLIKDGIVRRVI